MQRSSTISISRSFLAMALLVVIPAHGQVDGPRSGTRSQPSPLVSFEAIPWFSTDSTTSLINIHYRIREDFFVVLRNIESMRPDDFLARGVVLIELFNEQDVSAARHIRTIRLQKRQIPATQETPADIQGAVSFTVPPGTYTVHFNVEDRQSERTFLSRDQKVVTRPPVGPFDASAPAFVLPPSRTADSVFSVLNHGTDVYFGERGGQLFLVKTPASSGTVTARFSLTLQPEQSSLGVQEFTGDSLAVISGRTDLQPRAGDTLTASGGTVRYIASPGPGPWRTVFLPLPLERLLPGRARISVTFGFQGMQKSYEYAFRVLWHNQPASLRNMELAVDALEHIASEDEMAALRSFSEARAIRQFHEFWRKRDPDTTTAYNELMVEYYRRVDEAIRLYSRGNDANGYKTDRGRIFILYGTPTESRRMFTPNRSPREVWTYVSLKRRFVFEDQRRNGDYRLIQVEHL